MGYSTQHHEKVTLTKAYDAKINRMAGGRPSLLRWTAVHRMELKPGVKFDLTRHLYLADIYTCTAQRIIIYKASQLGASEYGISKAAFTCDKLVATVLYIFPHSGAITDFSSARIGPALESSPYLTSIVEGAAAGGKRGADRVTLKRIRDRFLYLRHASVSPDGNAPQLKSVDADLIILDELDEMDPRAPEIARKRLGHSELKEEVDISTPTYPNFGIHAAYQESDQREWYIPCPRCGRWQYMTIDHVILEYDSLERPTEWHGKSEGRAYAACEKCGSELDRLTRGAWVPAYPNIEIAGFHLTKLFSPTADLLEIVKSLRSTDETKRRECFNQDLGLPYMPRGGKMTDEILDALKREYGHGPIPGSKPFAGIDVGKLLHIVIRSPLNSNGERRQMFAGAVTSFEEAERILRTYHVGFFVIDGLPETRKSRELIAQFPDGVGWLSFYGDMTKREDSIAWNDKESTVNVDRSRILDELYAGYYDGVTNTLPAHIQGVDDYYDHLKAPVRVLETKSNGEQRVVYVETSPDHYAHAEVYCLVASHHPPLPTTAPPMITTADQFGLT